jgi:hypothetical protein
VDGPPHPAPPHDPSAPRATRTNSPLTIQYPHQPEEAYLTPAGDGAPAGEGVYDPVALRKKHTQGFVTNQLLDLVVSQGVDGSQLSNLNPRPPNPKPQTPNPNPNRLHDARRTMHDA